MNKSFSLCCFAALLSSISSCDPNFYMNQSCEPGFICVNFDPAYIPKTSKASLDIPDTNDFILKVTDASGNIVYNGNFGGSSQKLEVGEGTYTVQVKSCEFSEPLFDVRQFGDEQTVCVSSGQTFRAVMKCRQMNCGINLVTDASFRTRFPSGVLYLCSTDGRLMYGYNEKRTAYFNPGTVALELSDESLKKTLLSRTMSAAQMLKITLNSAETSEEKSGISMQIDTTLTYLSESYTYGGTTPGGDTSTALDVTTAKNYIGQEDVWIYGYIVGISTSSTKSVFEAPFSLDTNILLSLRSTVSDRSECLSVELPRGDLRTAINLKDNPANLGKQVYLKGKLVASYYGLPGLKTATGWQWK